MEQIKTCEEYYSEYSSLLNHFVLQRLPKEQGGMHLTQGKVIHDPIWGSVYYNAWEILIIDTPLFQRLRNIGQVGLANYTYPSARHSRFEHSLGVLSAASLMINRLIERGKSEQSRYGIPPSVVYEVRLAALLHDIGHCFCSHLSENIYGNMESFDMIRAWFKKHFGDTSIKPHEMYSYIIIQTPAFFEFFTNSIYNHCHFRFDPKKVLQRIANMIIGQTNSYTDQGRTIYESYLTAIINGEFDADKLDYIRRDGYSAGLTLQYDIERLLYKLGIHEYVGQNDIEYQLVVDLTGATALEELTFNKLMLNNYVYHHQKVLIAESVLEDLIWALIKLEDIKHPCDFLKYTDRFWEGYVNDMRKPYPLIPNCPCIAEMVVTLQNRQLPIRCLEVNKRMLTTDTGLPSDALDDLLDALDKANDKHDRRKMLTRFIEGRKNSALQNVSHKFIDDYRSATYAQILVTYRIALYNKIVAYLTSQGTHDINFTPFDIHVIVPRSVSFGGNHEQLSKSIILRDGTLIGIDDLINLASWAAAFNDNKWRFYVCVDKKIDIKLAYFMARRMVEDTGVTLEKSYAFIKGLDADVEAEYCVMFQ